MMPRRERTRLLLRGLAKLVGVAVVAGVVGVGLGVALAKLTGDDAPSTPDATASAGASTSAATTRAEATSPSTQTTARSTSDRATTPARLAKVRVRVLDAMLRPARTPSGIRRQRARVTVRVRAENTGTTSVTLQRPAILAAGKTVKTDSSADSPETNFGALGAGETRAVTLRFETAGEVTAQLTNQKSGRLRIAGRTIGLKIKVGPRIESSILGP